jgi:hypothetical protein
MNAFLTRFRDDRSLSVQTTGCHLSYLSLLTGRARIPYKECLCLAWGGFR